MKHSRFTIEDILRADFGCRTPSGQLDENADAESSKPSREDLSFTTANADANCRGKSKHTLKRNLGQASVLFSCYSCTDVRTREAISDLEEHYQSRTDAIKDVDKRSEVTSKQRSDRRTDERTGEWKPSVPNGSQDKTSTKGHNSRLGSEGVHGVCGDSKKRCKERRFDSGVTGRPITEWAELPKDETPITWPAWVYCTRYSDRPSAGPRVRKLHKREKVSEEKRPRTAFSSEQLDKLKTVFDSNHYLTEIKRRQLATELGLNEAQIKIWFQNKRAKLKKAASCQPLAEQLKVQGLYNHKTVKRDQLGRIEAWDI